MDKVKNKKINNHKDNINNINKNKEGNENVNKNREQKNENFKINYRVNSNFNHSSFPEGVPLKYFFIFWQGLLKKESSKSKSGCQ